MISEILRIDVERAICRLQLRQGEYVNVGRLWGNFNKRTAREDFDAVVNALVKSERYKIVVTSGKCIGCLKPEETFKDLPEAISTPNKRFQAFNGQRTSKRKTKSSSKKHSKKLKYQPYTPPYQERYTTSDQEEDIQYTNSGRIVRKKNFSDDVFSTTGNKSVSLQQEKKHMTRSTSILSPVEPKKRVPKSFVMQNAEPKKFSNEWQEVDDNLLAYSIFNIGDFENFPETPFVGNITPEEIQARWGQMLYGEKSTVCCSSVLEKFLWTQSEDAILWREAQACTNFSQILDSFREYFHPTRTASSLQLRFEEITFERQEEDKSSLEDLSDIDGDSWQNFSDTEEEIVAMTPPTEKIHDDDFIKKQKDLYTELELKHQNRLDLYERDLVYYQAFAEDGIYTDNYLGTLKGFKLYHRMTTRAILLGTGTTCPVDVNLGIETLKGDSISPVAAKLELKKDYLFHLINTGENNCFVNGVILAPKKSTILRDKALLEFGDVGMIFEINQRLVAEIEQRGIS